MDSGGVGPQLSEEATHHLQQGIVMLLSQWSALQMAVHNEWGGRQSSQLADQLALDIFSWFTHSRGNFSTFISFPNSCTSFYLIF